MCGSWTTNPQGLWGECVRTRGGQLFLIDSQTTFEMHPFCSLDRSMYECITIPKAYRTQRKNKNYFLSVFLIIWTNHYIMIYILKLGINSIKARSFCPHSNHLTKFFFVVYVNKTSVTTANFIIFALQCTKECTLKRYFWLLLTQFLFVSWFVVYIRLF